VTGTTRVAAKVKITILRMELVGVVNSERLTLRIPENVSRGNKVLHRIVMHFGHASKTVRQVQLIHRYKSEIKVKSDMQKA
jgi:hypothetical protein